MASPPVHHDSPPFPKSSIKDLSESTNLTYVPSNYAFPPHDNIGTDPVISQEIPTIDFSLLTSATPDQRSQIVCDLGRACREWGFFMLINHGVEKSLRDRMLDTCRAFFDLPEAEKREYIGKHVLDPIRYGTSFNPAVEKAMYWRDYLKVIVHPVFHSADKPAGIRYDTISKIVGAECYDGRGLGTPACSELETGGGYEDHRGSTVMYKSYLHGPSLFSYH